MRLFSVIRKVKSDFYDTEYAWCKLPEKEGKSKNSFMGTRQCFAHMHSRSTYLTEVNCWLGNRVGIPGMFKRGIERCSHYPIKIRQNLSAEFRSRKSKSWQTILITIQTTILIERTEPKYCSVYFLVANIPHSVILINGDKSYQRSQRKCG